MGTDHLAEARALAAGCSALALGEDHVDALSAAAAHALIDIAESLRVLAQPRQQEGN